MEGQIKRETPAEAPVTQTKDQFDYSRLYGDLCRKLLNTPVTEIFSDAGRNSQPVSINTGSYGTGSAPQSGNGMQPILLTGTHTAPPQSTDPSLFGGIYHQSGIFDSVLDQVNFESPTNRSIHRRKSNEACRENGSACSLDLIAETHDPIDIQETVDQFKVTLERYGVSQRFAARFIMQDTSQGNLSFLMEKGRVKKWEELSPRGRIPYIKMKAWLESKDLQLNTLNMLKYAQDMRKNCPKESYNRRERFSMFQLNVLCRLFEENPNPPMNIRNTVAGRLNIPLDRVNVWFQNQRARGFPARRILQQHGGLYSTESMKPDYETAQQICKVTESGAENSASNKPFSPPMPALTGAPVHSSNAMASAGTVPVKLEGNAHATKAPIDVPNVTSCTSLVENKAVDFKQTNFISKESSPEKPLDLSGPKPNIENNRMCLNNTTAYTGASKRKRGCKPQQIIQRRESCPKSEYEPEGHEIEQKRRRLSSADKDDTLLKGKCFEPKEYEYVLKTENGRVETSSAFDNTIHGTIQSSFDRSFCRNLTGQPGTFLRDHSQDSLCETTPEVPSDHDGVEFCETVKSEQLGSDNSGVDDNKENFLDKNSNSKTEILLKAMCASIVMEDKNETPQQISDPMAIVEPELD